MTAKQSPKIKKSYRKDVIKMIGDIQELECQIHDFKKILAGKEEQAWKTLLGRQGIIPCTSAIVSALKDKLAEIVLSEEMT